MTRRLTGREDVVHDVYRSLHPDRAQRDAWIERRSHYQHLSHDALVAIVVELLDERDRLVAAADSFTPKAEQ